MSAYALLNSCDYQPPVKKKQTAKTDIFTLLPDQFGKTTVAEPSTERGNMTTTKTLHLVDVPEKKYYILSRPC